MRSLVEKYTLVVAILGIAILIATGSFFSRHPLAIIGQLAAVAVLISAKVVFPHDQFKATPDPGPGQLVRRGPYRLIRHPMYASVLLLIWVSVLAHLSVVSVSVGIVVSAAVYVRIETEERLLRAHFADYDEYSRTTKRLVPFVF